MSSWIWWSWLRVLMRAYAIRMLLLTAAAGAMTRHTVIVPETCRYLVQLHRSGTGLRGTSRYTGDTGPACRAKCRFQDGATDRWPAIPLSAPLVTHQAAKRVQLALECKHTAPTKTSQIRA